MPARFPATSGESGNVSEGYVHFDTQGQTGLLHDMN